jgi:4'-phosphopantetheinyl transferase
MDDLAVYFLLQSPADLPEGVGWLAASELEHASGLRFSKRRNDWLIGRWTAKQALLSYWLRECGEAVSSQSFEIRNAADGAPEAWLDGRPAPVSLALSHSGGHGFCAVAGPGIMLGCDLEMIGPHDRAFVEDYFTAEEASLVLATPAAAQPLVCTLIWSAKESALKCLREGLRRDTRSVAVDVPHDRKPDWSPFTVRCRESSRTFHGWWRPSGPFVLTIAGGTALKCPAQLQA